MSKLRRHPDLTRAEITYINTTADAVRLTLDQCQEGQSADTVDLLTSVAATWMEEQRTRRNMPTDSFNMLASPATCRFATTQILRRLAGQTLGQSMGFVHDEDEAIPDGPLKQAADLVGNTLMRIMYNKGAQGEQERRGSEQGRFTAALNFLTAHQYSMPEASMTNGTRSAYETWWGSVDAALLETNASLLRRNTPTQVADTPDLRRELLAGAMREQMEWGVTQAFKIAGKGENTTGRILAAFGIPMTNEDISLHTPLPAHQPRSLRELQLAVRILADDLQDPHGIFNARGMQIYQDRLGVLGLPVHVMQTPDYIQAMRPAQDYADRALHLLGQVMGRPDMQPPPRQWPAGPYPASHTLH